MLTDLRKDARLVRRKSDAAPAVGKGDVDHLRRALAGSRCSRRPHEANRTYETVNDLDGLLCNAWRSVSGTPEATADAASWPVSRRTCTRTSLLRWRNGNRTPWRTRTGGPVMAGWWMGTIAIWIGSGWCSGDNWVVGADGNRSARAQGVSRQLPHLGNDGLGVARPQMREPGVSRKRPHLGNDGRGVAHADA